MPRKSGQGKEESFCSKFAWPLKFVFLVNCAILHILCCVGIYIYIYTSGKPRLTHVANSASGIHATGLGRVEVSNKNDGKQKGTLAFVRIHMC